MNCWDRDGGSAARFTTHRILTIWKMTLKSEALFVKATSRSSTARPQEKGILLATFPANIAAAFGCAVLSFTLIERPTLQLRDRIGIVRRGVRNQRVARSSGLSGSIPSRSLEQSLIALEAPNTAPKDRPRYLFP